MKSFFRVVSFFVFALALPAHAGLILDQSYMSGTSATSAINGQTFTVGVQGVLSKVKIEGNTMRNAYIDIYAVNNDTPVAFGFGSLASVKLEDGTFKDYEIDFSAFNISVEIGDMFAIVVHGDQSAVATGFNDFVPTYAGGELYYWDDWDNKWVYNSTWGGGDMNFQTYVQSVSVPEPSILIIMMLGLIPLIRKINQN